VAEGSGTTTDGALPGVRADGPFRAGPDRDPGGPASICRFLAIETADGTVEQASGVDTANRCWAFGEPVAQSGRQQELVCVVAAHVNCPRYLRGVLMAGSPPPPPARQPVSPAVIGAVFVLLAALAASFGFLAVRGGFNLPSPAGSPALVAALDSPAPSTAPSPSVPASTPAPTPSPVPSVAPTPSSTPPSTPSPTPTPTGPPATTPQPSSDRYAVLTKCSSTPDCWIYVIRAGDNLTSIAHWFGVSYSRMLAMNPDLRVPIHTGDKLLIPTPTR
jgi:LysM domain